LEDATLVDAGDGPFKSALQAQVQQLGLAERVRLIGRVPQERLWGLLAYYADVFVLNSLYEGLPHILLEAAYFGVPVVATAVGGTPEVVQHGETGLLVPPDSPVDLLAALQRLQADPLLRQRLGTKARRGIARFSFERMVEQTERAIEAVAMGGGTNRVGTSVGGGRQ
jgi:glycosyltransferase involved in cell wall biosynthesis